MTTHREIANEACRELKQVPGISKIVLYGSVARGEEKLDSDIDLAIIFEDWEKGFPLDLEGHPIKEMPIINQITRRIGRKYGIHIETNPGYSDDFEKGRIILEGTKYDRTDKLHEVGEVIYDWLN